MRRSISDDFRQGDSRFIAHNVRPPSQHLPSLRTELCETTPLLCCSVAWPPPTSLALGGPKALRPRLTTSLPFSPAHRRCACRPTSLPIGDRFATIFELVGVFFFDIFLDLRTRNVHRGFIGARYGIGGVGLSSEQLLLLSRVARWFPQGPPFPVASIHPSA